MAGENAQLDLAEKFTLFTGKNIFLTGKAGTGKTTFLHHLKSISSKRIIIVAPTGVAAINAGGVTIHSFFQMPFGPIIPDTDIQKRNEKSRAERFQHRFSKQKINIIKSLDLLVIDEISMVRADLLDGIDGVLRKYRDRSKPFGGVQLLLIGDLQQLAPVVKNDEWDLLKNYYDTAFFFSSRALKQANYITILLEKVYRQSDQKFLDILNLVRNNTIDQQSLQELNKRYIPGFINKEEEGYIILTTHNNQAKSINQERLKKLAGKPVVMTGLIEGDFPEYSYPTDIELELKVGAQVMFVKNDPNPDKQFYNGKIGVIEEIEDDVIWVKCEDDDNLIEVLPLEWENIKYSIDNETREISENIIGRFVQHPLKLAWAITIHKSQGLTFEKAIIDASAAFTHGQVYVALSRCKSLEGMVLNSPLRSDCFINNSQVYGFTKSAEENQPTSETLRSSIFEYEKELMLELFSFNSIKYSINHFLQVSESHSASLIGKTDEKLRKLKTLFQQEIISVQDKFLAQIGHLSQSNSNIEDNEELQARIKKAARYYSEKITDFINFLDEIKIESDNKEVKKVAKESSDKLYLNFYKKNQSLDSCKDGFKIKDYLSARAKAELEELPKRTSKKTTVADLSEEIKNPQLYAELIKFRNKIAAEEGLSHYMVIHLKALINLSNHQPSTLKELGMIKGIGQKKVGLYGSQLLKIISNFKDDSLKFEVKEVSTEKKKRKTKEDSTGISLKMFLKGMSEEEIAKERNFAVTTIESHLALKVASGELKINKLVGEKELKAIMDYFKKADNRLVQPAKEFLGENYSYRDIRYVQKYLEYLK
ncbi:MAG: helix-turn-helix domain-containing protein [Bacteroidales bacterium]|nr:helix-turn-helix domain-containing protein [Bacteroidales bacterium]MCF8389859.1 helix-turn-helix domain-containing protein [Bacteroidales bacterium]